MSGPHIPPPIRRAGFWLSAAAVAIGILIPFVISDYDLFTLSRALTVAIGVASLNLLMGFSGQISLGHGALFGIGGYATMMTTVFLGWPVPLAILAGVLVTAALGVLIGIPAVRMGGFNLSLLTIVIAAVLPLLLYRFSDFTGGQTGVSLGAAAFPSPIAGLTNAQWTFLVMLIIITVVFVGLRNLVQGRMGRALAALRTSSILAAAHGVDVDRLRLQFFILSSAVAGLGGALFALVLGLVVPESYPLIFSITLVVASVIGGNLSWFGALLGALIIVYVPAWASDIVPGDTSAYYAQVAFAVVLAICLIVAPRGLAGAAGRLARAARHRFRSDSTTHETTPSPRERINT
jgi:branched-chain amino acid transport system permease protein